MIEPILGLYGLETTGGADEEFSVKERIEAAKRLGVKTLLIDFPERLPQAEVLGNKLRDLLPALSGKMRVFAAVSLENASRAAGYREALDRKLAFLGLPSVDCGIFGPVSMKTVDLLEKNGFCAFLAEAKEAGKIRSAALWIYDRAEAIEKAARAFPGLDGVRFDYTPFDLLDRPGAYGYRTAENAGLFVIVSGLHAGGFAENEFPCALTDVLKAKTREESLRRQLLRFVARQNHNQKVVLTPESVQELEEALTILEEDAGEKMTITDRFLLSDLCEACKSLQSVNCTACGCCLPCPSDVDIPGLMALKNEAGVAGYSKTAASLFYLLGYDTTECKNCGRCVKICPKSNDIPELIREFKQQIKVFNNA